MRPARSLGKPRVSYRDVWPVHGSSSDGHNTLPSNEKDGGISSLTSKPSDVETLGEDDGSVRNWLRFTGYYDKQIRAAVEKAIVQYQLFEKEAETRLTALDEDRARQVAALKEERLAFQHKIGAFILPPALAPSTSPPQRQSTTVFCSERTRKASRVDIPDRANATRRATDSPVPTTDSIPGHEKIFFMLKTDNYDRLLICTKEDI
ncbi:uncharacterized protein DNG_07481 [Cephalotrichum gorgonifer]|uniref:Uncharacterized protein n=1 Tax=Cephalotrichum gorgonifer TaxID=2041049 RepID=A0AAE8N1Q6_9PEZI|nr:uncharacterized protein DNG_07481 [Cephalotrichum gorgonifer]